MTPTGIAGENSPVWLSAALVGVGLMSWLGAGLAVPTERGEAPDAPAQAVTPRSSAPATPMPPTQPGPVDKTPAPAERVPEPCAPVVELQFASGSSELADAAALQEIVTAAERFNDRVVVVEGYASATGSPHTNLKLSHRRAGKAKTKLVASGLAETRVRVQAFGEYRPNLAGDTDQDRRVLIRLEGMPSCPNPRGDE